MTPGQAPLETVKDLRFTTWLVFGSFCMSILMFGFALVLASASWGSGETLNPLRLPIIGSAAALAVAAVLVRRSMGSESFLRRLAQRSDERPDVRGFFLRLQTPMLVSLTLNEVVALMGFVLAFLEQNALVYLPFAAVALLLNAAAAPTSSRWLQSLRDAFPGEM